MYIADGNITFNTFEIEMMKFRDNTMVCGCTTKIILIHDVIKLNYGIRLEYLL